MFIYTLQLGSLIAKERVEHVQSISQLRNYANDRCYVEWKLS